MGSRETRETREIREIREIREQGSRGDEFFPSSHAQSPWCNFGQCSLLFCNSDADVDATLTCSAFQDKLLIPSNTKASKELL
jgi:hypothetical protein